MNPWMIIGALVAILGAFGYGHHAGYAQKETEDALEIARLNTEMNHKKEEQDAKDAKTKEAFETKLSGIIASRPRLYVPVASTGGCAGNANSQARAELDGQTAEDLIRLVAEGDRAIIDLNSCIDRYEAVRSTLNGQR